MTATTIDAPRIDRVARDPRRGILLMALGIALFSLLNAAVKWQSETFPINQIIFFRNAFALIPVLVMARRMGGLPALRTARPREQILLALVWTGVLVMMFGAYHIMPLADATAISFLQPIVVTLLSAPLAGDRVGWRDWGAVLIGIAGVLLMVDPTGRGSVFGAALAFSGMVLSAFSMIMQRRLSRTETSISVVVWTLGISAATMVPTLPFSWVMPSGAQLAGLIAMGLASGAFQYLTVRSLYHASAAAVSAVSYTKMIWAIVIGFVAFGDVPTPAVLLGTLVILASTVLAYGSGRRDAAAPDETR